LLAPGQRPQIKRDRVLCFDRLHPKGVMVFPDPPTKEPGRYAGREKLDGKF
jgi:hypothetical protein